jgi:hypothetical protein
MSRRFALILTILLATPHASAQSIAILELRFSKVPPALVDQLREQVKSALVLAGYSVVDQRTASTHVGRAGIPPGCFMGPCLTRVGEALKVDRVIMGGVAAQGTSYDITMTMLETGGGTALSQVNERCNVCTFKEVEKTIADSSASLHKKALVFLAARSILKVNSKPSGADVMLDGLPAGNTPMTQVVTPGRHTLEVTSKGLSSSSTFVDLEAGKVRTVNLNLVRGGSAEQEGIVTFQDSAPRRRWKWLPWTVLGASAVLGGIGGGLLAMDGTETSDPRYVHDTSTAGIALLSLGGVALVTSAVIFLLDYTSGTSSTSSTHDPQRLANHAFSF